MGLAVRAVGQLEKISSGSDSFRCRVGRTSLVSHICRVLNSVGQTEQRHVVILIGLHREKRDDPLLLVSYCTVRVCPWSKNI